MKAVGINTAIWNNNIRPVPSEILKEYAETKAPFFSPEPIWGYNLHEKVTITLYRQSAESCRKIRKINHRLAVFAPIAKTSKGCIMDCVSDDLESPTNRICERKDCPLLKVNIKIERNPPLTFEELREEHERRFHKHEKVTKEIEDISPAGFISKYCSTRKKVSVNELKAGYLAWCKKHSIEELSSKQFNKLMILQGYNQEFTKINGKSERVWTKVELNKSHGTMSLNS